VSHGHLDTEEARDWHARPVGRRDEITSDLAQVNPEVKDKIAGLYAYVFRLTQAP